MTMKSCIIPRRAAIQSHWCMKDFLGAHDSSYTHPSTCLCLPYTTARLTLHLNQPYLSLQVWGQISDHEEPQSCQERLQSKVIGARETSWGHTTASTPIHQPASAPLQYSHYILWISLIYPYRFGVKYDHEELQASLPLIDMHTGNLLWLPVVVVIVFYVALII